MDLYYTQPGNTVHVHVHLYVTHIYIATFFMCGWQVLYICDDKSWQNIEQIMAVVVLNMCDVYVYVLCKRLLNRLQCIPDISHESCS